MDFLLICFPFHKLSIPSDLYSHFCLPTPAHTHHAPPPTLLLPRPYLHTQLGAHALLLLRLRPFCCLAPRRTLLPAAFHYAVYAGASLPTLCAGFLVHFVKPFGAGSSGAPLPQPHLLRVRGDMDATACNLSYAVIPHPFFHSPATTHPHPTHYPTYLPGWLRL